MQISAIFKSPVNSLLALIFASLLASPGLCGELLGRFALVKGKVTVTTETGETVRARFGTRVSAGDTVVADGQASKAKIFLLDKTTIHILPKTKMVFRDYQIKPQINKSNLLGVAYGRIRNNIKRKYDGKNSEFQVRTKTAVAGVRGTDFVSEYEKDIHRTTYVVFNGLIAVSKLHEDLHISDTVLLKPGQMTYVYDGEAPQKPIELSKKKLSEWDEQSYVLGGPHDFSDFFSLFDPDLSADNGSDSPLEGLFDANDSLRGIENITGLNGGPGGALLERFPGGGLENEFIPGNTPGEICDFCEETIANSTANIIIDVNLVE